jgi:hypothetical protein
MRRTVRLTESDLARIVKRVIRENKTKNKPVNEGIGTAVLVLTGAGLFYLGRKLKRFIDMYGKYFSSAQLVLFLDKIKRIEDEDSEEKGEVRVKEIGQYTYLAIVVDGDIFDSLTIDMESTTIYSGHNKEPKQSDMIIPRVLPSDADTENIEKIKELEEQFVGEILDIIVKYSKPKNS